jgi:hypothetical protein
MVSLHGCQFLADLVAGLFMTTYDVVQRDHALAVANTLGLKQCMELVAANRTGRTACREIDFAQYAAADERDSETDQRNNHS